MELVELGHFYQGAGIGQAVFPRPVLVHLRRVSTVTPAVVNEELVVENEELAVENEELVVENQVVESKKSSDKDSSHSNTGSLSPQKQGKLEFEFEKGNNPSGISGDSSFSSEKQSLEASSSTEIGFMSDDEWEQFKNMFSEQKQQKEVTPEKNKNTFRTKNKLKRTLSGFAPNNQLERTQSEGFQAEGIPGFFSTKELDRTQSESIHGCA